jgi:pyruvate kinase
VDRFCIVGPASEHVRKLKELLDAGVTQFNIYLMSGDEEKTVEAYGRDIVPSLRQ